MTFEEADRTIKRGDVLRLRGELEAGLNPNLSNKYEWTILSEVRSPQANERVESLP